MSVTIELEPPAALVTEARNCDLLESARMGDSLLNELQRPKAARALVEVLEGIHQQPGQAMSEEEIAAEIKAARRERRSREAGR